jgi:hypothetical protein
MLYIVNFSYPLDKHKFGQYSYHFQDLFWLRLDLATNMGGMFTSLSTCILDLVPSAL